MAAETYRALDERERPFALPSGSLRVGARIWSPVYGEVEIARIGALKMFVRSTTNQWRGRGKWLWKSDFSAENANLSGLGNLKANIRKEPVSEEV